MAKKKHSRTPSGGSQPPTTTASSGDLKTLIHEHSLFFDRLVELIPARFYLPSDDAERPWFQGLSKAARASAKKETRENLKKARRDRLDPDKSSTTTLDLLKKSIESQSDQSLRIPDDRSVTYEELRLRLRRKIEELKGNRNIRADERPRSTREDKKDAKGGSLNGKRERDEGNSVGNEKKKAKKDGSDLEFEFGKVKIGESGRKGKGASKKKELERAEKLRESMRDPEKGEEVSRKHSWKAAVSRAAGGKVHDDPRLIRESMKKEKKRHEKSAEKWMERVETTRKMKAERQKRRAENIGEKIEKKKMKRIEKREKKLMRPGFEGRKQGYINEP